MNALLSNIVLICCIGTGATMIMDAWLMLLKSRGIATLNFAFIGRWAGHLLRGKLQHIAIAKSAPIGGELALGWTLHYATGIAFAAVLISGVGWQWIEQPTLLPAVLFGMLSVAVPLLIIQPAMGAGIMSRKTPAPIKNCLKSLATHSVFGLGLYLSAALIAII